MSYYQHPWAQLHKLDACGKTVHGVCTSVNAFSYFSLAPYAPIRDNPALTHNGGSWADNSRRAAHGATGVGRAFRHGQESRSLKKDANGAAFHSFFTTVEIAQGFLFSSDDNCNSNGARTRNCEFLGQISGAGKVPGQYQHFYD